MKQNGEQKRKPFNLKQRLISALRNLWRYSDQYHDTLKSAKTDVLVTYVKGTDTITIRPLDAAGAPTGSAFTRTASWSPRNGRRVMFRCVDCGRLFFDKTTLETKKGPKEVRMMAVDHSVPVVLPAEGFIDWNSFIHNLFDGPQQVLCNYPGEIDGKPSCHHLKTKAELAERTQRKRALKSQKEKS